MNPNLPKDEQPTSRTQDFEGAVDHLLQTDAGHAIMRGITTELLYSPHRISAEYWRAIAVIATALSEDNTVTSEIRFHSAVHKARARVGL